jgi:hypothetical protein
MTEDRTPEQARQGRRTGFMPYVLGISVAAAAIILFGLLFIWM